MGHIPNLDYSRLLNPIVSTRVDLERFHNYLYAQPEYCDDFLLVREVISLLYLVDCEVKLLDLYEYLGGVSKEDDENLRKAASFFRILKNGPQFSGREFDSKLLVTLMFWLNTDNEFAEFQSRNEFLTKLEEKLPFDTGPEEIFNSPIALKISNAMQDLDEYLRLDSDDVLIKAPYAFVNIKVLCRSSGISLDALLLFCQLFLTVKTCGIISFYDMVRDIQNLRVLFETKSWTEYIRRSIVPLIQSTDEMRDIVTMLNRDHDLISESINDDKYKEKIADYLLTHPVFKAKDLENLLGVSPETAFRTVEKLKDSGTVITIKPAAGRRPAIHGLSMLMKNRHFNAPASSDTTTNQS